MLAAALRERTKKEAKMHEKTLQLLKASNDNLVRSINSLAAVITAACMALVPGPAAGRGQG